MKTLRLFIALLVEKVKEQFNLINLSLLFYDSVVGVIVMIFIFKIYNFNKAAGILLFLTNFIDERSKNRRGLNELFKNCKKLL